MNMLAVITTTLLQPLIGYILDAASQSDIYTIADYQTALLTIPASLLFASVLVWFIPEKKIEKQPQRNHEDHLQHVVLLQDFLLSRLLSWAQQFLYLKIHHQQLTMVHHQPHH